jgi:hypothetical protein
MNKEIVNSLETMQRIKLLRKYQHILCEIYNSQVLGHVCLESFDSYLKLSNSEKLAIQNELKLFYLKKPNYITALKLIERKVIKLEVINTAQISEKCYYKLLNNPIVQKYVYHNDIAVKLFNAKQRELSNYDSLDDNLNITNAEELVRNLYYHEKSY